MTPVMVLADVVEKSGTQGRVVFIFLLCVGVVAIVWAFISGGRQ